MRKTAAALIFALGLAACGGTDEPTLVIEGEEVPLQDVIDEMEEHNEFVAENGFEQIEGSGCWILEEDQPQFRDAEAANACHDAGLGITPDGYVAYSGWVHSETGLMWDGEQYHEDYEWDEELQRLEPTGEHG